MIKDKFWIFLFTPTGERFVASGASLKLTIRHQQQTVIIRFIINLFPVPHLAPVKQYTPVKTKSQAKREYFFQEFFFTLNCFFIMRYTLSSLAIFQRSRKIEADTALSQVKASISCGIIEPSLAYFLPSRWLA